jgi:hypothetical protein
VVVLVRLAIPAAVLSACSEVRMQVFKAPPILYVAADGTETPPAPKS